MKTRIITAAILLPVLLLIILVAPKVVTAICMGVLCALASYELLWCTGFVKKPRLAIYTAVMAFLVPIWCYFGMPYLWMLIGIWGFAALLFMELLISKAKLSLLNVAVCAVSGLVIPFMLSALVRLLMPFTGRYLILVPFILAFLSDTGAYFAGRAFGKHKLAPVISPNKTVEGVAGGVVMAIVGMMIFCLVMQFGFHRQVNYFYGIVYGILGSLAGVFGDLSFSAVKRQTGIKDYGHLMPGHGGVLDRFDSVSMVAPLTEILMLLIPVVV